MKRKSPVQQRLDVFEKALEACRLQYEMFFSGIEAREPYQERERLFRELRKIRGDAKSSRERFRLNTLNSRFNTYKQYWERVKMEREHGTYHKDRMKARRRMFGVSTLSKPKSLEELHPPKGHVPRAFTLEDLEKPDLGRQPTTPKPAPGLSESRMKEIFQDYVESRRQCQESTSVTYQALQKNLKKQVDKLEERGYKNIDFKVIVKDGKTTLKAVGKKKKQE